MSDVNSPDARLKLRHLHAFAAIAREHTVQRAAESLSLTASAVSKALQELEEVVGHALFKRTRKGLIATKEGEQLLRHVVPGLALVHDGLHLASGKQQKDGLFQVSIGVLPTVATALAPHAVAEIQKRHSRTEIKIVSGTNAQLLDLLRTGTVDMVLGRLPGVSLMRGLSFEPLYTEQMLLVARPKHALAGRDHLHASHLLDYPLVLPLGPTTIRDSVDTFFLGAGVTSIPRVTEALSESFCLQLVLASDAVWFSPIGSVKRYLASGELQRLNIDTSSTTGTVGMTRRAESELSVSATEMAETFRAHSESWMSPKSDES